MKKKRDWCVWSRRPKYVSWHSDNPWILRKELPTEAEARQFAIVLFNETDAMGVMLSIQVLPSGQRPAKRRKP